MATLAQTRHILPYEEACSVGKPACCIPKTILLSRSSNTEKESTPCRLGLAATLHAEKAARVDCGDGMGTRRKRSNQEYAQPY